MQKKQRYKQLLILHLLAGRESLARRLVFVFSILIGVQGMAHNVMSSETLNFIKGTEEVLVQERVITGTVVDGNGVPVAGATVHLKNSPIGVVTSFEGTYSIKVPAKYKTMVFTFLGMVTKEITVTDQSVVDVVLVEDAEQMDEVVIVGYQEIKKKDATASVVSVKAADIENFPAASFEDILQGKLAGVNVQSLSGEPGVKNVFVIRGNTNISTNIDGELNSGGTGFSNPLYVVDGVPTTLEDLAGFDATNTNFLASLNPNDIESIDILKDASAAAIYGSRGANGVVIIKTKKGKTGEPVFTFNTYVGVSNTPDLIDVEVGRAESAAKWDGINNYWDYDRLRDNVPMILSDSLNPMFNNNVNYQGLFYKPAVVQNYDFGVSGGTETTNYRLGIGYYNEEGIVVGTGFERISATLNLGVKLSDKLDNQTVVRLGYVDRKTGLGASNNPAWGTFPINPLQMNTSLLYVTPEERKALLGEYEDIRNVNINFSMQFSNTLRYKIAKGLYFNNLIAVSTNTTKKDYFSPSTLNSDRLTYANYTWSGTKNLNLDNYLSYSKTFKEIHKVNALLGTSINYNQNEYSRVGGKGAASDNIQTVTGIDKEDVFGATSFSENGMASLWYRLGYKLKDKYLVDFNFRTDGSSRFGKNTRWGYFPAISAGWVFSEESFINEKMPWISFAKLYASYGVNGSQFSNDYLRFNTYNSGGGYYLAAGNRPVSTYNGTTVVNPNYSKIANEDLSWERSVQWNLAMDLELFNRRIFITPEIYNRETKDLLFDVDFPIETGYANSQANIAGVRNYGWELSLNAYLFDPKKDFQWQIGFNVAHNENQITALPNGGRDWVSGVRSLTVGMPLNSYYFIQNTGEVYSTVDDIPIDPYTGGLLPILYNGATKVGSYGYVDVDGDYVIEFGDDHIVIPNADPNPKFTGGFTNTFSYKNWNLRVISSFVSGRTIYNKTLVSSLWSISKDRKADVPHTWANHNTPVLSNLNYWRQPGDVADIASLDPGGNNYLNNREQQSRWLEDGSYLKIGSVTLSYNFKRAKLKKLGFKALRLYSMMNNVAIFQKFTGPDAERVNVAGYDIGSGYALPRKVTFGMNVKF